MAKSLIEPKTKLTWLARLTLLVIFLGVPAFLWTFRLPLSRLFPIDHTGQIKRIKVFHKGGWSSQHEHTRQLNQFAIIFEDGFQCEGTDTSFAAIEPGDTVNLRGYHDVRGVPLLDPEWWECDEAQLLGLVN